MRARDWIYQGEGGKHAIFSYQLPSSSTSSSRSVFATTTTSSGVSLSIAPGSLLRVDKSRLTRLAAVVEEEDGHDNESGPSLWLARDAVNADDDDGDSQLFYARNVVQKHLPSHMIDLPQHVHLAPRFAFELRKYAMERGKIPSERRRKDWEKPSHGAKKQIDSSLDAKNSATVLAPISGQLLQDYRLWHSPSVRQSDAKYETVVISFEIKPKAGYLTTSPLVDPRRRVKYQVSRFQLFQQLTEQGRFVKPWMATSSGGSSSSNGRIESSATGSTTASDSSPVFRKSRYDPLDLFSGERDRIRKAIYHLIESPQNNLKVWRGTSAILDSCTAPACQPSIDWQSLVSCLGRNDRRRGDDTMFDQAEALDQIADMVSAVLDSEPCLASILSLQKLDWLDGDGASLIYQRLVELCSGSHEQAQAFVDADPIRWPPDASSESFSSWSRRSPLGVPDTNVTTNLAPFLDRLEVFARLLETYRPSLPPANEMDDFHSEAMTAVHRLSQEACVYLLQNWLLSLAMCDVSFFISFRLSNDGCSIDAVRHTDSNNEKERSSVLRLEHDEKAGLVQCRSLDAATEINYDTVLDYRVRIIDYDKKPAKKLRTRLEKESCLDWFALDDIRRSKGTS